MLAEDTSGTTRWFIADAEGSIRKVLSNDGSSTFATYDYDAFGNILSTAKPERFGYTGQAYDAETGLCYYGMRYYDSKQGRFISGDPAGMAGSGTNLYP